MTQQLSTEECEVIIKDLCGDKIQDAFKPAYNTPHYFKFYLELFTSLIPLRNDDGSCRYRSILNTPAAFHELATKFKAYPDLTNAQVRKRIRGPNQALSGSDIEYAIDSVLQLNLMIDCRTPRKHSDSFVVDGYKPAVWNSDETLIQFFSRCFPTAGENRSSEIAEAYRDKGKLACWKLVNRARVVFRPTDDLREHLLYEPQGRIVYLFRHIPFLTAHLSKSQDLLLGDSIEKCLEFGTLPPQLLLETLHSLRYILFPAEDTKCDNHLQQLVRHGYYFGNDNEAIIWLIKGFRRGHYDTSPKRMDPFTCDRDGLIRESLHGSEKSFFTVPSDFTYQYWGNRLVKLHELANNPNPVSRYRLGRWYQRHNSITVGFYFVAAALCSAILLGIVQIVISILAWKSPVKA